jgi:chemotaxis response regulator CheB
MLSKVEATDEQPCITNATNATNTSRFRKRKEKLDDRPMKAIIVGGSIGGLSAAAALLRNGFSPEDIVVLERAAKIIPAGAVRMVL